MAKIKTLTKQKSSLKKLKAVVLHPHKILDEMVLDRETLKSILMEALIDGDIETLKDVEVPFVFS